MLRAYPLKALILVLFAGCSAPVCRQELVAQTGRCVPKERPVCEPACSAALHQVCDNDEESPTCICAPGYEGNPCAWTGVLEDPGFQKQSAWTLSGGANVLERGTGPIDLGFAQLEETAACFAGAVSQTVQMPSYEAGEPLVAELTYRARGLYGLALGFNRAETQLPQTENPSTTGDVWRTERICLGEAAYGGAVTVRLSAPEQHFSCFDEGEGIIEVDRLDIVLADSGECPAPGQVLNGTAEVAGGGWRFETTGVGIAELAEDVGREASAGVRLVSEFASAAVAWTRLSVPTSESLPSPALRFWWQGTTERLFQFRIGRQNDIGNTTGNFPLEEVWGNDSEENFVYCLPPWTHGNVVELISRPLPLSPADGTSELAIDDVEIISETSCGSSTDILDPAFDAAFNAGTEIRVSGVTDRSDAEMASVTLLAEPSLSRTEDGGVLELSYWNEAAVIWLETWVFVPESEGNDGPSFAFWSKVPEFNEKPIRSVLGRAAVNPADLQVGGDWTRNEVCLPPAWSERWYRVQWRLGEIPPLGDRPVVPPVRIYIDDLELTTSSACPSE